MLAVMIHLGTEGREVTSEQAHVAGVGWDGLGCDGDGMGWGGMGRDGLGWVGAGNLGATTFGREARLLVWSTLSPKVDLNSSSVAFSSARRPHTTTPHWVAPIRSKVRQK
jgi:hypothetical protein